MPYDRIQTVNPWNMLVSSVQYVTFNFVTIQRQVLEGQFNASSKYYHEFDVLGKIGTLSLFRNLDDLVSYNGTEIKIDCNTMSGRGEFRVNAENTGWEGHGGYMLAKARKLEEQFDQDAVTKTQSSAIFQGVAIYVDGWTDPSHDELKVIMAKNGGRYHMYYSRLVPRNGWQFCVWIARLHVNLLPMLIWYSSRSLNFY